MSRKSLGGACLVGFGLIGLIEFALEVVPAFAGYDGDNPAAMLRFLENSSAVYVSAGLALVAMSVLLIGGVLATRDALEPAHRHPAVAAITTVGLFAAAFFMVFGVTRFSAGPITYIAGLNRSWGEAAYLAIQMFGVHGFGQAAILALVLWTSGVALAGARSRALPRWLVLAAVIPALRLVGLILALLGLESEILWAVGLLAIPGTSIWCVGLGFAIWRSSTVRPVPSEIR